MQSSRFVWLCKSKIGLNHNIMTKTLTTLLKISVFTHLKCLNVSTFHWAYSYHKMITIMILPMCARRQNSGKFQAKLGQIVTKTLITSFKIMLLTLLKCLNVSTFHLAYNYHKMIIIKITPPQHSAPLLTL